MIRFIICNLDIVYEEGKISEGLLERIGKLKDKGILFSVAGRETYDCIRPMFENYMKDMLFICDNGTVAFFDDAPVYKYFLERRVAFDILREARKDFSCNVVVNGERGSYALDENKGFIYLLNNEKNIEPVLVPEIYKIKEDIVSLRLYRYGGIDDEMLDELLKRWGEKADFIRENEEWISIIPSGVNKGLAVSTIGKLYDISFEDTMTFGIDETDIPMFDNSFFSYAMQQSDKEIRNCSKHIAADVESIIDDVLLM